MLQAVGDDEIVGMKQEIIDGDLLKNLLGDIDVRSFIFNDHTGVKLRVVEHAVGTKLFLTDLQADLVGKEGGRVAEMLDKIVYEGLAHTFLWREGDIAATQDVEDTWVLTTAL